MCLSNKQGKKHETDEVIKTVNTQGVKARLYYFTCVPPSTTQTHLHTVLRKKYREKFRTCAKLKCKLLISAGITGKERQIQANANAQGNSDADYHESN